MRGSDFLMRWSQGRWSEDRIVEAVNATTDYYALPYGPSSVAPDGDVRAFELYMEELERAGLGQAKRPDVLIFHASARRSIEHTIETLGGIERLPFVPESEPGIERLLSGALLAVECENSLWKTSQIPDFGKPLRPQRRLGGLPGLAKSAVLPTITLKEEDRAPLKAWQSQSGVPIHIWQVFYDRAYGIQLDESERLIAEGLIEPRAQIFQAPGGATTTKTLYFIYYQYAYQVGEGIESPGLAADYIIDANGHILPYVRFAGGRMILDAEARKQLARASHRMEHE